MHLRMRGLWNLHLLVMLGFHQRFLELFSLLIP